MLLTTWLHTIINFDNFAELLPLVSTSIVAAVLLGVMADSLDRWFRHGTWRLPCMGQQSCRLQGAACALWLGSSVTPGAVIGAVTAGMVLGSWVLMAKPQLSGGILLPFGLGLGGIVLSLYQGRSSNKFGLLTGQIVAITPAELQSMLWLRWLCYQSLPYLVSACYLPQLTRKLPKHSIWI